MYEAWRIFDRLTALGCKFRGREYDPETCSRAWDYYMKQCDEAGVVRPQTPIGYKEPK